MKKIFLSVLLIFSLWLFAFGFSGAQNSSDTGWKINEFNVNAEINENQKVTVSEEIKVDFNNLEKHGIIRTMPYQYSRSGNTYNVRIKINSVTDDKGNNIQFAESKSMGNLEIKIGDPNVTITGKNTYKIDYEIERVINHFSDHDEFYWNVTGTDNPVPIEATKITVNWPFGAEITQNICYVGAFGSNAEECKIDPQNSKITFSSDRALDPGEGFTIASGIKPGTVKPYSFWKVVGWFLSDNWAYIIPFLVLGWLIFNYYKNGRDPQGKNTVVPEFAPPDNLRPAVLGTLFDEKVDTKDISAVIIDLAVRGYLKIKEIENKGIFGTKSKDYEFTDTNKKRDDLANYEKEIMDGIFDEGKSAKLSDLRNKFYTHIKDIREDLYKEVTDKKYFLKNPNTVRGAYLGIGIALIALGIFFIGLIAVWGFQYNFAAILSGIFVLIFAASMPKRTDLGVETNRKIKGFKLYMYTAERYREKFNEKEKIFERYLPYAMVYGIVKEWANAFKDMQIERPDWYEGRGAFYPVIFATNLESMQNNMNSTMVSSPSSAGSGGSGFSGGGVGGGFGGGGTGSW